MRRYGTSRAAVTIKRLNKTFGKVVFKKAKCGIQGSVSCSFPPVPSSTYSALGPLPMRPCDASSDLKPGRCPPSPARKTGAWHARCARSAYRPEPRRFRSLGPGNHSAPAPAALAPSSLAGRFRGGGWGSAPREPPSQRPSLRRARRPRVPSPPRLPAIAAPSRSSSEARLRSSETSRDFAQPCLQRGWVGLPSPFFSASSSGAATWRKPGRVEGPRRFENFAGFLQFSESPDTKKPVGFS